MTEPDVVSRTAQPATITTIARDLRALGLEPGVVAIVHASLSSLGWVVGGAQAVIDAVIEVLGPAGTLVVPTHSGDLSDPAFWENPPVPASWWATIRAEWPAYRPDATGTRGMGAIPAGVLVRREAVRSDHPQVSFAALGHEAAAICAVHPLAPALGAASPLGRIAERDGVVVLLGVDHGSNTSLHLAEERADWPGKAPARQGAPLLVEGARRWVEWDDLSWDGDDFAAIGAAFAADTGRERVGTVGRATARLCRQREVVAFAADWIARHRGRP